MSRHHYEASKDIVLLRHERNWPFYSLIMAAMREADSDNLAKLQAAWPEVWADLLARYDAPGGRLPDDPPWPGDIVLREEPDHYSVSGGREPSGWSWVCRICRTKGSALAQEVAEDASREHLKEHAG